MKIPTFHRLTAFLANPGLLFYVCPWLMALIVAGTVTQPSMGLYPAVDAFLLSWVVWCGPLPLPGGLPTLGLLAINMLARFLFKSEWTWPKAGIHLAHFGVLVMLFSGLVTVLCAREGYMVIPEGRASAELYAYDKGEIRITPPQKPGDAMSWGSIMETLPFTLQLSDFVRETYPGTETPSRYYSDVTVQENGQSFPTRIDMNEPLRMNGYTFYQSSFLDVGEHQATVLQVVRNQGRLFPYVSCALIGLGLLLHLVLTIRRRA